MAGFDLSNYKTVPERIAEAKALYPDGRFQTELLVLPPALADKYIAVKARFFRCEADPIPGEGIAWEVVPGKTPYTKDSELQNAETSAWGRALVAAFAVDASKGIASREEVQNRQPEPRPRSGPQQRTPRVVTPPPVGYEGAILDTPQSSESHEDAPRTNGTGDSGAEVRRLKSELLAKANGDKPKAMMVWRNAVGFFGLEPDQDIPADMIEALEAHLNGAGWVTA